MIINIPTAEDYKRVGIECLVQAYKNIFTVDNFEMKENVDREAVWEYKNIVLRTSIVLVHQGIEPLLKAEIGRKSMLLLLANVHLFNEKNGVPQRHF